MSRQQGERRMHLGAFLFNLGNHAAAWRHPGTPPGGLMDLRLLRASGADGGARLLRLRVPFRRRRHQRHLPAVVGHTVTIRPEPTTLLAALAAVTEPDRPGGDHLHHLPRAVCHCARTFATLDHLSGGRAAMNVVTSSTDQEAQNHGADAHMDHAARYRRAAEFVDVLPRAVGQLGGRRDRRRPGVRPLRRPGPGAPPRPPRRVLRRARPVERAAAAAGAPGADPGRHLAGRAGAGGGGRRPGVHRQHGLRGCAGALPPR